MSNPVKKNRLTPKKYDEVSLVDAGANQDAHVLIYKRQSDDVLELSKRTPQEGTKYRAGRKVPKLKPKPLQSYFDAENKVGGKGLPHDKKKKRGTTKRAKNWKEDRHARDKDGEWDTTSSESKKKYGKNGTTKAKLKNAERHDGDPTRRRTKGNFNDNVKIDRGQVSTTSRLVMKPGGKIVREKVKTYKFPKPPKKKNVRKQLMENWIEGKGASHGS
jgi:hypothetical protein